MALHPPVRRLRQRWRAGNHGAVPKAATRRRRLWRGRRRRVARRAALLTTIQRPARVERARARRGGRGGVAAELRLSRETSSRPLHLSSAVIRETRPWGPALRTGGDARMCLRQRPPRLLWPALADAVTGRDGIGVREPSRDRRESVGARDHNTFLFFTPRAPGAHTLTVSVSVKSRRLFWIYTLSLRCAEIRRSTRESTPPASPAELRAR